MQSEIISSINSKVLLAASDIDWGKELQSVLKNAGHDCHLFRDGKECQLALYKEKYSLVILDPDIRNHSGVEVLKYLKLKHPGLRVALLFTDRTRSAEYEALRENHARLGISKTFTRPLRPEVFLEYLDELNPARGWKRLTSPSAPVPEEPVKLADRECTRVELAGFLNGDFAIFDLYIRLRENHYVKIVRRGENIEAVRIQKYLSEGVTHLYFLTRDRKSYINYMNTILATQIEKAPVPPVVALNRVKSLSEMYIEEIHTRGLKPELIEEGRRISENMHRLVREDRQLANIFRQLESLDPKTLSHSFLVSFFATLICKGLPWVGPRTLETVVLGSFFHDLGELKLPAALRNRSPETLSPEDRRVYERHPELGAEMITQLQEKNPQLAQIIFQHHERCDGTGYPNGLPGIRIFPLAKIVALADAFAELMTSKGLPPLEALRHLLQNRECLGGFDPTLVRSLAQSFIREEGRCG